MYLCVYWQLTGTHSIYRTVCHPDKNHSPPGTARWARIPAQLGPVYVLALRLPPPRDRAFLAANGAGMADVLDPHGNCHVRAEQVRCLCGKRATEDKTDKDDVQDESKTLRLQPEGY